MQEMLYSIGFSFEETQEIKEDLLQIGKDRIERVISLLLSKGSSREFVRELIISRRDIFLMDYDRFEYMVEAILANDDIIEEILLDIV